MSSSPNSSSSSEPPAGSVRDPLAWVEDVPCPVDVVLGTTTITVRDCANFVPQAVVRLKQAAGSDLEVRVAGVAVAMGEVVIVDENVGLRLSRVLPPRGQEVA